MHAPKIKLQLNNKEIVFYHTPVIQARNFTYSGYF